MEFVHGLRPLLRGLALAALVALGGSAACGSDDPATVKADAIRRADALMEKRQYTEAAEAYQAAVDVDPRDGALRVRLARAHQGAQQWEAASRHLISASELLPADWNLQLEAVRAMLGMSRFTDAADRMEALLTTKPEDPELLVLLATAIAREKFYDSGIRNLETALRGGESVDAATKRLKPRLTSADFRRAESLLRKAYASAPERYDTVVALASFLWMQGNMDEGAGLLKIAADRDPSYSPLSRPLALFYESRGRYADAELYLRAAAKTGNRDSALALAEFLGRRSAFEEALQVVGAHLPGDPDGQANLRAADIEYRRGRYAEAGRFAATVLIHEPANAQALRIKASVAFIARDFATAATAATAAVTADPWSVDAHWTLGRARAALGELQPALSELTQAWRLSEHNPQIARELAPVALQLGQYRPAADFARRALSANPNDRDVKLTLVRALIGAGEFLDAEAAIAPLLGPGTPSAELLLLQARIQVGRGSLEAARNTYLRALQVDQDSLEGLSGLVSLEIDSRNAPRIRARVDEAAARHAADPAYLMLAARVAIAAGDPTRAESTLRAILAIDRGHEPAVVTLAEVLGTQQRTDDAIRDLQAALKHRPTSLAIQLSLAMLFDSLGRTAEARTAYERLLADHPLSAPAAYRLALIYADQNERLNRALELAIMAKQVLPNDPAVSDAIGWVYLKRNLPASAMPHLEQAVRKVPTNAIYRYHLGTAYLRIGQRREAFVELTRALELDPRFRYADDARAALSSIGR